MKNKILTLCDTWHTQHNFSGVSRVKTSNTIIFEKAYGYAHRGFMIPNTIDTMFDSASIAKLFTAISIVQLVQTGLLSFEDRITDIIDLKGTKIPNDVTIHQLLSHTSGIADDADEEAGEKYEDLFITKPNYSIRNCIDFLPQFAYKDPIFPAGSNVRYNNCAYILLGLVIENITKHNYRDYVRENIIEIIQLSQTGFPAKDDAETAVAEGYFCENEEAENIVWRKNIYSYPPIGTADGGICTSVKDLDRLFRAIKNADLVSPHYSDMLFSPQAKPFKKLKNGTLKYGFGFQFRYDEDGNLLRIFKDGVNAGVGAMAAYYPSIDTTSIILANQDCDIWELHRLIGELLLQN